MTSRDFVYWLQGLFEISEIKNLNEKQVNIIKNHLKLVFKHEIDPSMPDLDGALQEIHDSALPSKPSSSLDYLPNDPNHLIRC